MAYKVLKAHDEVTSLDKLGTKSPPPISPDTVPLRQEIQGKDPNQVMGNRWPSHRSLHGGQVT
jgi:hypothetical protein